MGITVSLFHPMATSTPTTIAELGEEGVIELLARRCPTAGRGGRLGIGDDAAVVRGGDWVVTTDLLVEQTHFDWRYSAPADVGHKALTVNLSDVAAMGAVPGPIFLTLGLPPATPVADLEGFAAALGGLARTSGAWLAGGDTVAAPAGWVVGITLLGRPVAAAPWAAPQGGCAGSPRAGRRRSRRCWCPATGVPRRAWPSGRGSPARGSARR